MTRIEDIKAEIDADPLARGYSGMGDQAVADSMNAVDRPAAGGIDALRTYLLLEQKSDMSLMGRMQLIAESAVGSDPLGDAVSLTLEHITSARALLRISDPATKSFDYSDSRFDVILADLAAGTGCKSISPAQKTAIQALSDNLQSRGVEIGVGKVELGHVERARALP